MQNVHGFFWIASSRGPLKVRYSRIAGVVVLDLEGMSDESGISVSWRDLAPSDRATVSAYLVELNLAVSA